MLMLMGFTIWVNLITTEACSPSLENMVYFREIIPIAGRKIQGREIL